MPKLTGSNLGNPHTKSEKPVTTVGNHEIFPGFSDNRRTWPFVSRQHGSLYYIQGMRVIFIIKCNVLRKFSKKQLNLLMRDKEKRFGPPHLLRQGPQSCNGGKSHHVGAQIALTFGFAPIV